MKSRFTKEQLDNAERHTSYLREIWGKISANSQTGTAAKILDDGFASIVEKIEKERAAIAAEETTAAAETSATE